jgi:FimV-like protein
VGQQQSVPETKRFGKYLRKIREERRLSLDAVEEMSLGLPERVTKSHLSRIENGQAVPSFPRMFTLSQIYGVPVSSLAERFELCLKAGMFPGEAARKSVEAVLDDAKRLRLAGRHGEALLLYESLLERTREIPAADRARRTIDLRLNCIACLKKLSRLATAKEECEKLLSIPDLTLRQQILAFQYLAGCCYRLGKYTVALMAIEKAEQELRGLGDADDLAAVITVLKGNLHFMTRRYSEAADAFRAAWAKYSDLSDSFEACRTRLNLASALIELGDLDEARDHLQQALKTAEDSGYDRQRAFALSHLALLAYREHDLESAEVHCLRSNRLARSREYISILFRNCFYLWRIAQSRRDEAGIRTNERTLRTYVSRVEGYIPEVEEFRAFLGGGSHD